MISRCQQDGIHVLHLGSDENRFSLDWLSSTHQALDEITANPAPLVTIGEGKFYSNGLDLEWLMANPDQLGGYVAAVEDLLARVVALPVPTIAAVSGHAFGAGAMLAVAHDWRVMREDRGYFCFPEVDIRIPFTPGMAALIQSKLTPRTALEAMTTGTRYSADEARNIGLVEDTATEADLLATAMNKVAPLIGKDPGTLGAIKATMFAAAVQQLRADQRVSDGR
jgi:enoyl-CoA hydratase/carnithine racemase